MSGRYDRVDLLTLFLKGLGAEVGNNDWIFYEGLSSLPPNSGVTNEKSTVIQIQESDSIMSKWLCIVSSYLLSTTNYNESGQSFRKTNTTIKDTHRCHYSYTLLYNKECLLRLLFGYFYPFCPFFFVLVRVTMIWYRFFFFPFHDFGLYIYLDYTII